MKRPFAVIGFTAILTLLAAPWAGFASCAALSVFMLAAGAVLLFAFRGLAHRGALLAVLLTACICLAGWCAVWRLWYEPAAALDGHTVELTGVVTELPQKSGQSTAYLVRVSRFAENGRALPVHTTVRLLSKTQIPCEPFDTVRVKARVYLPSTGGVTGYDSRSYYRSKGVYLFASPLGSATVQTAARRPLYAYAIRLRQAVSASLARFVTGEPGALAAGILIGDTSGLSSGIKSDFTATGISHILAVSGTQTSLITQYLLLLFAALRLPRRPRAVITMAAVAAFMAVTGFSPSVMRAGIMSLLFLAGMMIGREPDALNSLGFSVLVLCAANPFAAADTGLLLSFTATLGMITFSSRLHARLLPQVRRLPAPVARVTAPLAEVLCQTVGASVFTYPVIVLAFRQLSTVALLSNLLEVPVSLFVTLCSAVLALMSPFGFLLFLIRPLALLVRLAAAFMIAYAHLIAQIPFANLSTAYGFVDLLLAFFLLSLLAYALFKGRGAHAGVLAVCLCFTVSVSLLTFTFSQKGVLEVVALPVSNGSSTLLLRDGHAIVVDLTGYSPDYQVRQFLRSRNIPRIDALILCGFDQKRADAANSLIKSMPVSAVVIPGAYRSAGNPSALFVSGVTTVAAWGNVSISLYPNETAKNLVASVHYGASSVLVTGGQDLDAADYPSAAGLLKADVVAFGGSLTANAVRAVSPHYAEASDPESCLYASAKLQAAGCALSRATDTAVISVATRGNGEYRMSELT